MQQTFQDQKFHAITIQFPYMRYQVGLCCSIPHIFWSYFARHPRTYAIVQGDNGEIFPWYADCDPPNPNREQRIFASIARHKQKSWCQGTAFITIDIIQDFHIPIIYKGDQVTLHKALIYCRTSGMGNFCLFSSVDYIPRT